MPAARRRSPPDAPGQTLIPATATDQDGLVGTATAYLQVRDPNDTTPPVGLVRQLGALCRAVQPRRRFSARSPPRNLDSWTLEIATPSDPNFTVLATGNAPVSDGPLAQLDPDDLANGFYQLLLTATDFSGRTVDNDRPDRGQHRHQAERH